MDGLGFGALYREARARVRVPVHEKSDDTVTSPILPLRRFVEQGWNVIEPELQFIPNWHIDAIAEHLEWVAAGEITRLIINIPPGHAKSMLVSVMFPAWMWTWRAGWRSIFGSYDQELSTRDAVRSRMLLTSEWYRETFEPAWRFTTDQNVKSFYRNDRMGERMAVSVGGRSTGFRGHCVAIDDPLNVKDAHSETALETATKWLDQSMSSRLLDPRTGARVMIMQRVHEKDPTGHLLAKDAGYVHLMLPTEYEPARQSVTVIAGKERWRDPRTKAGELLFPQLYTPKVIEEAKTKDLGTWGFAAQHQQSPLPATGGIFERAWFPRYKPRDLPPVWHETIQSWDLTFKKREDTDFVVGGVWSRLGASCYRRYERRDRMGFGETKRAIREVSASWPEAHAKLIEDKANGPAIIEELRTEIPGIIAVPNNDGTLAQAWAVQPFVEAGNVFIPEGPEGDAWLDEVCAYPKATYDDRVSEFVQAVIRLMRNARGGSVANGREEHKLSEAAQVAQSIGGNGPMPERW